MASEWVGPNYSVVDIAEYEIRIEKRRRIEDFCLQFFKDYWTTTNSKVPLVQICQQAIREKDYAITERSASHLTLENFDDTFQAMCLDLFKNTDKNGYVVSLLVFCIELDACLQDYTWYSISLLIDSLVDALEYVHFNPPSFNLNQSNLVDNVTSSVTNIIPALLLFYILFK